MKKLLFLITLFFLGLNLKTEAQKIQNTVVQQQIQAELEKRGLNQAEVEARMLSKGIDINNIKPEDAPRLEPQIQAILKELENEKKARRKANSNANSSNIDDGEIDNIDVSEPAPFENKNKDIKSNINTKSTKRGGTEGTADDIAKAIKEGEAVDVVIAEKLDELKSTTILAPVYGMQIFRNNSIKVFRKVDEVKAGDNYILGTGDELAVSLWGVAEYQGILAINKEGYVQPDRMPRIFLNGMTYKKAREVLKAQFSKYYPFQNESFSVTVNYKRTLTVNIYGEVFTPGGYTIPATNTAFNALVAAGGPSDIGSVRRIQLVREGEKTRTIDVYEFMNNASVRDNFYLQDNDIIQVPIADRVVAIQGAVRRPYRYELLANENLVKLVELSGGLADSAYYNVLQIKRYQNDKQVLLDVNYKELKESKGDFTLLPGDIVMVNKIPKPYDNVVSISGAVDFPKSYELLSGMKINSLIQRGVLSNEARKDIAHLQRANVDGTFTYIKLNLEEILANPNSTSNLALKPKDALWIYGLNKFTDQFSVSIGGAVRNPYKYPFDAGQTMRIEDAVLLAGGLKAEASDLAYILRSKPSEPNTKEYIRINIKNALLNKQSIDNLILQPSDSLFVLNKKDYKDVFQVRVDGSVRNPGTFQYDESLYLKDVLTLAGGLLLQAASNRIEISRVVIKNNEATRVSVATLTVDENFETQGGNYKLQPFDQINVRTVSEFEFQKSVTLEGEVKFPGNYTLTSKNETLASLIQRAGGLTDEAFKKGAQLYRKQDSIGYVVMDLEEVLSKKDSRYNYFLKENDRITIPKMKDLVTIQGATKAVDVYNSAIAGTSQISAPFHNGKRANFYITEYSGGFSKNAKRADVTVLYPNGKVKGTNNLGIFKLYPKPSKGSVIRVAYKELDIQNKDKKEKEKVDWEKLFANTIAQASGILTLILLAQQLSK